jgi:NAD(P)-dependent dehydrogenase (short-subunit alcohol dehydrogenase family)
MTPVVVITGASHGIGLAAAECLAKAGWRVYATVRDLSKATELQKLILKTQGIAIEQLDVSSSDSVNRAIKTIIAKEGRIDAVVNNAGFGIFGPAETHTVEEARSLFDVNVFGVLRVMQAVLPLMRKQKNGRIINISSISGVIPSKNIPIYSACKAALESLSASDAYALAPWNIKVSLIQPGPVLTLFESRTPYGSHFKDHENPYYETLSQNREAWAKLMKEGQSAEEVAKVILQALQDSSPKLWYQTSQGVRQAIGKHFKDLSGNGRIPQSSTIVKEPVSVFRRFVRLFSYYP